MPSSELVRRRRSRRVDIECYLRQRRLPGSRRDTRTMAAWLHRRTGGNPLFVANLFADLRERAFWAEPSDPSEPRARLDAIGDAVPDSLRRVVAAQIERLEPRYRELLLAASVAGDVFCTGVLGAALDEDAEALDDACQHLSASARFIRHFDLCQLPDGTFADRYAFIHVLYPRQPVAGPVRAAPQPPAPAGGRAQGAGLRRQHAPDRGPSSSGTSSRRAILDRPSVSCASRPTTRSARYANRPAVCHLTSALELLERGARRGGASDSSSSCSSGAERCTSPWPR